MTKVNLRLLALLPLFLLVLHSCEKKDPGNGNETGVLQLVRAKVGTTYLDLQSTTSDIPLDKNIVVEFSGAVDTTTVVENVRLTDSDQGLINTYASYLDGFKSVVLDPAENLENNTEYILIIGSGLKGSNGEQFPGVEYRFLTTQGLMSLQSVTLNGESFQAGEILQGIDGSDVTIEVTFSEALDPSSYQSFFILTGTSNLSLSLSDQDQKVTLTPNVDLEYLKKYFFTISSNLTALSGAKFNGFSHYFYTAIDSTPKFPQITDDELLKKVQEQTFKYFYDFAHPASGMARERNTSGNTVTSGGSGFGIMALIVGIERGFITRSEGLTHMDRILDFLESCDRFHGAWSHWINGNTGDVQPFGTYDNGADLVETAFLVQGLLTFRQYLDDQVPSEQDLIDRINVLWEGVEWDWFTRGGQNALYWHWSPNYEWQMNMQVAGHNETIITHILAASSTAHGVSSDVYRYGYARNGGMVNGNSYYGISLPIGYAYGGPLFFTHYSYLGLDPRSLEDTYANHWQQNINHSLINRAHCINNPNNFIGYSAECWGLTASDNHQGYSAHSPTNDLGVITPTAAISSIPYTPTESMEAIRFFYYILGDKLWGEYGFYDAFNMTEGWYASSYLAIDQGPIISMIENYRTQLLWDLFMSCPEIQTGLTNLGFTY